MPTKRNHHFIDGVNLQTMPSAMRSPFICLFLSFSLSAFTAMAQPHGVLVFDTKELWQQMLWERKMDSLGQRHYSASLHKDDRYAGLMNTEPRSETRPLLRIIAQDLYVNHLGVMCQKELQLERLTKLPLRFRLGSKEEVDRLEGKFISNR